MSDLDGLIRKVETAMPVRIAAAISIWLLALTAALIGSRASDVFGVAAIVAITITIVLFGLLSFQSLPSAPSWYIKHSFTYGRFILWALAVPRPNASKNERRIFRFLLAGLAALIVSGLVAVKRYG